MNRLQRYILNAALFTSVTIFGAVFGLIVLASRLAERWDRRQARLVGDD